MKRVTFHPKWREGSKEPTAEFVLHPTAEWFAAVRSIHDDGGKLVRFALMENGDLFFGDAYDVVHLDICQLRFDRNQPKRPARKTPGWEDPVGKFLDEMIKPIFVSVMSWTAESGWRICNTQFFLNGMSNDGTDLVRKLLPKHVDWVAAVGCMGGADPCLLPGLAEVA